MPYDECHIQAHYAECHFAKLRYLAILFSVIVLIVSNKLITFNAFIMNVTYKLIMLSTSMKLHYLASLFSVVVLNVVAPFCPSQPCFDE